ncbi:hypothetical protein K474DRAFT_157495 [Panus rudis PR-1116 ss-1]|nr:hypothetical protein K474DRAFT_157495 [Panus rudis PR-1116 ss-1]
MAQYNVTYPGIASPVQQYSPIPTQQSLQYPTTTPGSPPINPGSITYTTSIGPNGQVIYNPFRAVPASYKTAQGIVHGIQWVPIEATSVLPTGATPASDDILASLNRRSADDRSRDWYVH